MQKRTGTGAISSPTAQASFGANIGAHELAAWADRIGVPAHTPEAQAKSNALAAKGSPAPGQPFAPGVARFNQSMNRYSDPDDTANDLSTPPTGKWGASAAPQGVQGLGNPASSASPTPPVGQPFAQGAAPPVPLPNRAEARDRIREAIAMQRAYEDDNGTPSQRATFNLQRRQARQQGDGAPPLSPRETAAFNQADQHFENSHLQSHANAQPQPPGGPSGKPRGFQIHHVQAAAQRAKGNQYTGPDDDGSN